MCKGVKEYETNIKNNIYTNRVSRYNDQTIFVYLKKISDVLQIVDKDKKSK